MLATGCRTLFLIMLLLALVGCQTTITYPNTNRADAERQGEFALKSASAMIRGYLSIFGISELSATRTVLGAQLRKIRQSRSTLAS